MINSKDYWNNRFQSGNWEELGGRDQTTFFNKIAIDYLPQWIADDIITNNLSLVDLGCAEGSGTSLFKNYFSRSKVTGIDFSESAINQAISRYPACEFLCQDIDDIQHKYDIVFSSNVLEHFRDPFSKLDKLSEISSKYLILLLPFQEDHLHEEHFIRFDYSSFTLSVNNFYLCYHKVINTNNIENTMWPGKQILLVYVNKDYINYNNMNLSKVVNNDYEEKEALLNRTKIARNEIENLESSINKQYDEYNNFKKELLREQHIQNLKIEEKEKQIDNLKLQLEKSEHLICEYKLELEDTNKLLNDLIKSKDCKFEELKETTAVLINNIKSENDIILQTKRNALELVETKSFKLVHLLYRIKRQFLIGNMDDKKQFIKWLGERKNIKQEHKYNPMFQIIDKLELTNKYYYLNKKLIENFSKNEISINNITDNNSFAERVNENNIEHKLNLKLDDLEYKKQDIIFLSVISWNFRYQRPQHLSSQLAKLGHRVFYFNVDFKNEFSINKMDNNLYIINLDNHYGDRIYDVDFSFDGHVNDIISSVIDEYNIRDSSVIVEYPSWYPVCSYLKNKYNFNINFDYIDDYEGFEETTHVGLKNLTENLFEISNVTIATSNFLYEKTMAFCNNVELVRNGTEFEFFNQAFNETVKKVKKVGYYGAIAEWFDIEKIDYLARNLPEVEIELIGNVSYDKCLELSKHKNVKFLGEKDYSELIKFLKDYDVCLIPFRSDIDLIKATNPVKFYEYLSAGKKIVATEIPELEEFRDKYVYLANDKNEFFKYVKLCLDNNDTLAPVNEKIEFAKSNDWKQRCLQIENIFLKTHELVSIIIVTYNNLEYTKQCIESILNKSAYPSYEIIVVDNASKDETPKYLKDLEQKYENIKVILNNENKGFAGGNNDGLRVANGKYFILLNNDTLVTRGWIKGLIKHIEKDNIGMVCPVTNSIGNEAMIKVDYKDIKDMDKFAIEYTTINYNKIYEDINVLAMFCVAFSREVFEKVGFLDENYKVGMFEDDDYSAAVKKAGYRIACVEDVFIHHFGNVSFKKINDKTYRKIFENNKSYFEKKWNVKWVPHKYRDDIY